MSLYLRVKRRNQTFFILAEPHDTFLKVKETLASILTLSSPNQVQLWHTNKQKELLDAATVADQEIENDAVVYLCLKKENTEVWEDIQVAKLELDHDSNNNDHSTKE
ncbi:hypothetical protein H257_10963 [Aphanomyces astaci]|uniref:Ubiquitin-like domain-containing protein n=1 Tax=Aphanomyces astaci TaxID=112090 RepID=W4G5N5_APHAT|nr:hypothetical protein H257_10963 [Aphanomyces astaci]ETV74369.1 hypothetical protein H257_10963 [Aphanomyces astaci]KAF0738696.1 hypothetical protein AaE_008849 [Aphanomyces astaci]RHX97191.1 hypothetical protein DYB36_005807 [Aphanomyces astaci]RHY06448.1 hypothetical protein DYB25_003527 [Aphanomyces astaci]RHY54026.1 hypothetical protein DYB38_001475 [Aphanomyces astaci]|eukprot:XP_009836027.1 hypothetical protein H257_10963 [Aphanomyces astaci]